MHRKTIETNHKRLPIESSEAVFEQNKIRYKIRKKS